jgi:hypothetical protein
MIRASSTTGLGMPLLFLGLSGENLTRLAAGEPIHIQAADLQQLGLPAGMDIVIHYGRTEDAIASEIRAHGIKLTYGTPPQQDARGVGPAAAGG